MSTETHAIENAQAWLENIMAMVKRLEHAGECSDVYCATVYGSEIDTDIHKERHSEPDDDCHFCHDVSVEYHNADAAREAIEESPLSAEVRSGWMGLDTYTDQNPSDKWNGAEYRILLTTGGPALHIIGELDQHGEPETARLEYQDWGTPWTEFNLFGVTDTVNELKRIESALLTYARQFYYGE